MDRKIKQKNGNGDDRRSRQAIGGWRAFGRQTKRYRAAGSKIVTAFQEVIEAMQSGSAAASPISVHTYKAEFTCPAYGPEDVQRVRHSLGMSQVMFARFLGVDPNTVRSWEQGTRPPSPIARRFMGEVEGDPEYWRGPHRPEPRNLYFPPDPRHDSQKVIVELLLRLAR